MTNPPDLEHEDDPSRHGVAIIYRPPEAHPANPRLWGTCPDGWLWAVMCRDCDTLGGHADTCRRTDHRRKDVATAMTTTAARPSTTNETQPASVVEQVTPPPDVAAVFPGMIPQFAAAPGNIAGIVMRGGLTYAAAVLDVWASLLRSTGRIYGGGG